MIDDIRISAPDHSDDDEMMCAETVFTYQSEFEFSL